MTAMDDVVTFAIVKEIMEPEGVDQVCNRLAVVVAQPIT